MERIAELGRLRLDGDVEITGRDPALGTPWPVGEVAAVALANAGSAAGSLARRAGGDPGPVRTDVGNAAATTLGFAVMRVDGESMARTNAENPWVGRYRCADERWIHLHGGFPALAERLASLLDLPVGSEEATIAAAVSAWGSTLLEDTIGDRRGCSAIIRTEDEWRAHPQGRLVHTWPTVVTADRGVAASTRWAPSATRPLDGLRVLDLTRVLAGPTCGRTLAAFGADVLHVRGPAVPVVPAFVVDTGHGKRQAHADFGVADSLAALRRVALDADVVVQGYRPGVVARYGLDEESLRADGFGGVFGSVSAFGHVGPWSDRAGWEQPRSQRVGCVWTRSATTSRTCSPARRPTTRRALRWRRESWRHSPQHSTTDGRAVSTARCAKPQRGSCRVGRLAEWGTPTGFGPTLLRSETDVGVVDHLGPCVDVEGLDIGWRRPTTPLGAGTLSW